MTAGGDVVRLGSADAGVDWDAVAKNTANVRVATNLPGLESATARVQAAVCTSVR